MANLQEISANNAPVPQVVLTFDKPVRKAVDFDFTVTSGPEGALFRNPVTDLTGNNTDTITLTLTYSLTADEKINVVISDFNDDLIADANQTADISDVVAPAPVAVEPILADDVVVNGNNGKCGD